MELKPGYKQTEVGVIPVEWSHTTIRGIASNARNAIVGGPFGSDLVSSDYVELGVPVIRGQNMSGQWVSGNFAFVTPAKAKSLEANLAHPGDIVFTQRGTLGQVSLVPEKPFESYLVSQSQMKLSLNREAADTLFFFYVFTSEEQQELIRGGTIQTGVPHVNLGILRDIPVQLPPLHEQRVIARALGDVDALLGALTQLIAKKRDLKQAALQQLLTGNLRLPGFHGDWEIVRFSDLADKRIPWSIVGGPFGSNLKASDYTDEGVRIIQLQNIGDGRFNNEYAIYTSDAKADELLSNNIYAGEIILSKMGDPVARACFVPNIERRYLMASDGIRLAVDSRRFEKRFVHDYINSIHFRELAMDASTGSTRQRIGLAHLRHLPFVAPPLREQTAIATVLSDMEAEIAALESRRDKTRALKQGMMQELLTGRTRLVSSDAASLPQKDKRAVAKPSSHNWQINEAVVISVLARQFGTEKFPLGRKRYTKLAYLLHRHVEKEPEGYLKKAAGPYNPRTKYKGPEGIAQRNGYVRTHANGQYSGFVAADNIGKAEEYFQQWYGQSALHWLEQFRFCTNDQLELLATVDMAVRDLQKTLEEISLQRVKAIIRSHPEWEAKLTRPVFADPNITAAMRTCEELFG